MLVVLTGLSAPAAETVWLTSLDLGKMQQGWGKPQVDRSSARNLFRSAGNGSSTALAPMRSACCGWRSTAPKGSRRPWGWTTPRADPKGSITFKIVGDGKTLWQSDVMRQGDAAKTIDLDLRGVRT